MNTLYGQSLNTELRLEAYRTLYPQYIPDSSLGLEGEAISRGKSRLMQFWIINFSNNTIFFPNYRKMMHEGIIKMKLQGKRKREKRSLNSNAMANGTHHQYFIQMP